MHDDLKDKDMIVYQIRNKIDNKSYIGQSTHSFSLRYGNGSRKWWKYVTNKYLRNAIKKHKERSFEVILLESNVTDVMELDRLESLHIKRLNTLSPHGYNYVSGGQQIRGTWMPPECADRVAKAKSGNKVHKLLNNRTGEVHEFVNVNRFSRENGLSDPCLHRVLHGESSYQGIWSLPERPMRRIHLISPIGEEHILLDGEMSAFCRKHSLPLPRISRVINKKDIKQTCGWTGFIS